MAKTGIGFFDQGLEALEEGVKQTAQGVVQQAGVGAKSVATQLTGSNYNTNTKPQESAKQQPNKPTPDAIDGHAASPDVKEATKSDNQDMLKALYGASEPGQSQQSSAEIKTEVKSAEEAELAKTRQQLGQAEQEKLQKHQQQHNEVYFDKLNKPEAKAGQKEESTQEKVEREKEEEEQKKQMELQEKQKKDEKVNAPSKNSAEHERKLGG